MFFYLSKTLKYSLGRNRVIYSMSLATVPFKREVIVARFCDLTFFLTTVNSKTIRWNLACCVCLELLLSSSIQKWGWSPHVYLVKS